jgi:glutamate--cysteine ligase catalytic subunit
MEVQITDFENAALTIFVALLSRAVLHFSLNFYMKISAVDENMARASARGAALEQKVPVQVHDAIQRFSLPI